MKEMFQLENFLANIQGTFQNIQLNYYCQAKTQTYKYNHLILSAKPGKCSLMPQKFVHSITKLHDLPRCCCFEAEKHCSSTCITTCHFIMFPWLTVVCYMAPLLKVVLLDPGWLCWLTEGCLNWEAGPHTRTVLSSEADTSTWNKPGMRKTSKVWEKSINSWGWAGPSSSLVW